jgi:hypothetical protein
MVKVASVCGMATCMGVWLEVQPKMSRGLPAGVRKELTGWDCNKNVEVRFGSLS